MRRHTFIFLGICLSACSAESPPEYHADIAPILARHCAACHTEAGAGGFELRSFAQAKSYATQIAHVTRSRTMPPQNVNASGDCQTFPAARWLSDAEIEVLERWAQDPREGDGVKASTVETAHIDPLVPTQTLVSDAYLPSSDGDDYRCFVLDAALETDQFLTGVTVQVEPKAIGHHVLLFSLSSSDLIDWAQSLDAQSAEAGFDCSGSPGNILLTSAESQLNAVWAPGGDSIRLPEGTGMRIAAHSKFVAQVHHNTARLRAQTRTHIGIRLEAQVEHEGFTALLDDFDLVVEPGQAAGQYSWEIPNLVFGSVFEFGAGGIDVLGVFPHMHQRGVSQKLSYVIDDTGTCMFDVPRWNFDWQEYHFYDKPVHLDGKGSLKLDCTYDTRGMTQPLEWGEDTADEMCMAILYYTLTP